ncbi:MAG: aspartate--tRNA ligase [Patescibacteria group bacterium]
MYRTHTCGELNKTNANEEVTLSGWVHKSRDLGGLIFIDLRDRYGITQVTVDPENKEAHEVAEGLHYEYVVKVTGKVVVRPEKMVNKELATGEIELCADKMEILSKAEPLPFEIFETSKEGVKEDLRLTYRFLDLRREPMQKNIMFRDQMVTHIRQYMHDKGYIHIDTPILTSSSPEGARDFLVPSRLHPGKFYALPQAPQQYKQLLMVAGFDKYFQIAPCMRDEDPRADRVPGEFYQLDVESSFLSSQEFQAEMEPLFFELTEDLAGKKAMSKPFVRIPYLDAMNKYGSDRPDLRYELELSDVTEWGNGTDFNVFKTAETIKVIVVPGGDKFSRKEIDEELAGQAKKLGAKGLAWMKYVDGVLDQGVSKFFNETDKEGLIKLLALKDNCVLLFVADKWKVAVESLGRVRQYVAAKLDLIDENLIAWAWIVDFPMYEKDEETGEIKFCHNPFSMPIGGLQALQEKDPLDVKADQYDIIANGYELSSGAVRNYDKEIMYKAFSIVGHDKKEVDQKFGAMINSFKFGAPPTCGFAPGIERLMMVLLGIDNIREVVPFPKNSQAQDLMMGAPGEVDPAQLAELGIRVEKKES